MRPLSDIATTLFLAIAVRYVTDEPTLPGTPDVPLPEGFRQRLLCLAGSRAKLTCSRECAPGEAHS